MLNNVLEMQEEFNFDVLKFSEGRDTTSNSSFYNFKSKKYKFE